MRGSRAFVVLTFYLSLLGAFTGLMYLAVAESSMSVSGQSNVGEVGRTLFVSIVAIEMLWFHSLPGIHGGRDQR